MLISKLPADLLRSCLYLRLPTSQPTFIVTFICCDSTHCLLFYELMTQQSKAILLDRVKLLSISARQKIKNFRRRLPKAMRESARWNWMKIASRWIGRVFRALLWSISLIKALLLDRVRVFDARTTRESECEVWSQVRSATYSGNKWLLLSRSGSLISLKMCWTRCLLLEN